MFEIDWDTEDDRRRRRRKASTIHGWLCMWRGTLIGNERERQRGRREMKEARAVRAYYSQRAHETAGGGGPFSLFRLGSLSNGKRNANNTAPAPPPAPAPAQRPPQRHRSHSSQHHHYHRGGNRTQQQPPQNRPAPIQRKSSRQTRPARAHAAA
ncbi:hypothetical protein EDB86DRAFT_314968 [Lactarius hatsudake]|nr:hypothetical protein EDB86DRAFT_314968 [Lactarius hatsudake]